MTGPRNLLAAVLCILLPLTGLLTTSGCTFPSQGDSPSPSGSGNAAEDPSVPDNAGLPAAAPAGSTSGVTQVPEEKLAIGDYMPPLDDDRIEIAKPQGWQALPRDGNYLTRFYQSSRNGLPRIEITVEPRTYGELTTVTEENVEQFAKLVAAELADLELVENVIPLQIGKTACARYVGLVELKLSAANTLSAERQRLLVLQDGRLYTIDLLVLPKTLLRSRDAAYAVCASLRFGGADQPPSTEGLLPE